MALTDLPDTPGSADPPVPQADDEAPALTASPAAPGSLDAKPWTPAPAAAAAPVGAAPAVPVANTADVPAAADLARRRLHPLWLIAVVAVTFLSYLALLPRFLLYSSPPTGDQPFYLMAVASLVQDGDLNVKNNYDQHDEVKFYDLAPHPPGFVGMSAPRPLPRQLADAVARPPSEQYDAHLPGLALLLTPSWLIGSYFALWWPATIVFMCVLGALLAGNVFLLAYEASGRLWIALAVWAAIAFSNPVMTYSYLIFTELATGLLLIYAFRRLALGWRANGWGRLLLVGACIGYIPWLAWRCVPIAAGLGLYALVQWWRASRSNEFRATSNESQVTNNEHEATSNEHSSRTTHHSSLSTRYSLLVLLAPIGVSAALLGAYNWFLFGTLLSSSRVSVLPASDPALNWPWESGKALRDFVTNGFGLLFDIQYGLLIYAPVYLLAAVGAIALWRCGRPADRRLLIWIAVMVVPYSATLAAFPFWTGLWCPPARYATTLVPLLAAPLALALGAPRARFFGWLTAAIFALLAGIGFLAMAIMWNDPIRMWPFGDGRLFYSGIFDWLARAPDAPLHFDLTHVLPSFVTPDELQQPLATGVLFAGAFVLVVLGALGLRAPRRRQAGRALGLLVPALIWLASAGVLATGWLITNSDYLQPKTLLTQQQRWVLPHPLHEPTSIAYLDGKIYITSLGPRNDQGGLVEGAGELGAFDLRSGTYSPVPLISAQGVITYGYPGNVLPGPDPHTLYVLNNGPGPNALLLIQPDGHVLRQIALDGKATLSLGLAFGPDKKIYATDMATIQQFGSDGGKVVATWANQGVAFTNIMGLAVDPNGRVYGAESSEKRVQVLDNSGKLVQSADMRCQPFQLTRQGDWIDVVCNLGLRSINWQTGAIQVGQLAAGATPLNTPLALAYGPDGTLYLLDSATLTSYTVRH